jgi:hypothetical protein
LGWGFLIHHDLAEYSFCNEPRKLTPHDYDEAIREFTAVISQFPAVESILLAGSVNAPGISDLDFIVVLTDNAEDVQPVVLALQDLYARNRYIYLQSPFLTTRNVFENLSKWVKMKQPRLLHGEPIFLKDVDAAYQLMFLVDLFNDAWPSDVFQGVTVGQVASNRIEYACREFMYLLLPGKVARRLVKKRLDVRYSLCKLHNAAQAGGLLEELIGAELAGVRKISDRAWALRQRWFQMGGERYRELLDLMNSFPDFCGTLMDELVEIFEKEWFEFANPLEYVVKNNRYVSVNHYSERYVGTGLSDRLRPFYASHGIRLHILPNSLAINEYLRRGGEFEGADCPEFESYRAMLEDRDRLIAERNAVLAKHGMIGLWNRGWIERGFFMIWAYLWRIKLALAFRYPKLLLSPRARKMQ